MIRGSRSSQAWEYERVVPGGIVVGVDGSPHAIEALNTATGLARMRRCPLHVVAVLEPFPTYRVGSEADRSGEKVRQLRVSLKNSELGAILRTLNPPDDWTHGAAIGRPAEVLTSVADGRGAELLVIGRRRHGLVDRVLGDDTALEVIRQSPVPVLSVDVDLHNPALAIVAMDFSGPSVRSARLAIKLLGASGTLYLAYVPPLTELLPVGIDSSGLTAKSGELAGLFERLIENLEPGDGIRIKHLVLSGPPASALVALAKRSGADFIAAGSHGHGRFERFVVGSVTTGLIGKAPCAILVAPPSV